MKANKKGISLIVLVITIIVIIILAAAIILSMNNNNPIAYANQAVTANDKAEAQSALTVWLGARMAQAKDVVSIQNATITSAGTSVTVYTGETAATETLSTASFDLEDLSSMTIVNNKVTAIAK